MILFAGTPSLYHSSALYRPPSHYMNALSPYPAASTAVTCCLRSASWLILVVLISAGNAVVRKAFDHSSNAWLEIQWYLFSAVFLLGAGYTLLRNEHIRIDIVSSRLFTQDTRLIDILGTLLFLLPMAGITLYYGGRFLPKPGAVRNIHPTLAG